MRLGIHLLLLTLLSAAPTIAAAQITPNTPSLSITVERNLHNVGETLTAHIIIDTANYKTDGVEVRNLKYNPNILELVDADPDAPGTQITPGNLYAVTVGNNANTNQGTIDFGQVTQGGATFSGTGILATAHFKVIAPGKATLSLTHTPGSTTGTNVAVAGKDILGETQNITLTLVDTPDNQDPQRFSTDQDGDGLKDWQENLIGTNPQSNDTDGDGYSDARELRNCYDPKTPNTKNIQNPQNKLNIRLKTRQRICAAMYAFTYMKDANLTDTDNDMLPDTWEQTWGTNPNNADSDSDGYEDGVELFFNYNPLGQGKLNQP